MSLSVSLSVSLAVPLAVLHPCRLQQLSSSACRRRRVGGGVGGGADKDGTDGGVSSAACRLRRLWGCWVLAEGAGGASAGDGWGLGLGDTLSSGVLEAGVLGPVCRRVWCRRVVGGRPVLTYSGQQGCWGCFQQEG